MAYKKFNIILMVLWGVLSTSANASISSGNVGMEGSIVEATCNFEIAGEESEQYINVGYSTVSNFIHAGRLYNHKFDIYLRDCSNGSHNEYYEIVFRGKEKDGNFALNGNMDGVVMQLIDEHGAKVTPGVALPAQPVVEEKLSFYLRFVGKGELGAGYFTSTILFSLSYY